MRNIVVILFIISVGVSCKTLQHSCAASFSKMSLLTRKEWIIDSVYQNCKGPGTGTLAYVRGGTENVVDLDKVRSIFWDNGQFDTFDASGNYHSYTWNITNKDSTNLTIISESNYTISGKILKLDATHFVFYDSTNNAIDFQKAKD
ncbi:MAG TPA: hypothetical protein VK559_04320 [Ferruginibacter sp.]|nr:hypothetical protein [Ferruginibacter sp.]